MSRRRLYPEEHLEFPAFRHVLGPMRKAKSFLSRQAHLSDLEVSVKQWLCPQLLYEIRHLPGRRLRWLPMVIVFFAFLHQVLHPSSSCREAVRLIQAWWSLKGRLWAKGDTNSYCEARRLLSVEWLRALWQRLACSTTCPLDLPGIGKRRVFVVDGTTLLLPDTQANQKQWPQPAHQKAGGGFPIMRVLGVFCLGSGALMMALWGSYKTSEHRLFACLRRWFQRGDILVADRGFTSFGSFAFAQRRGLELICRERNIHKIDWKKGKRLGPKDRLISLPKSKIPQTTISSRWWSRLPKALTLRRIHIKIASKGYRVREFVLLTTLTEAKRWPAATLAALYRRRWEVELHFHEIKTTMQAESLRCKAPAMVHREVLMHAIAYTLVRRMMRMAAESHGRKIEQISFKGTVDSLRQWTHVLAHERSVHKRQRRLREWLALCAKDTLPHRPGRREPRALKRRPKTYQLLTKRRDKMREISHRSAYKRPSSLQNDAVLQA